MNNWISDLVKNNSQITLNNLILPGTHNSASTKLNLDTGFNFPIISNIIENWTLNQDLTCYNQLVKGVRMFDIDISYINDKFYTSHTFIIAELQELIDEFKKFNHDHGDIYIVKFICRHNLNSNNVFDLANIINNHFKDNIIYPENYYNVLDTPISKFINNKKNMIIYMQFQNHNFYSTAVHLYSSWTNDNQISESISNNNQVLNKMNQIKSYNTNILTDLNWTLTPTYYEVIYGLFCYCDYYSVKTWIKKYNTMFFDFYTKNKSKFNNVNVVSFDFINDNLISKIIGLNKNKIDSKIS